MKLAGMLVLNKMTHNRFKGEVRYIKEGVMLVWPCTVNDV